MHEAHFILATAGHVDHGKSALIKALTGADPDRLPEEKRRGITIDLGFASLELSSERTDTRYHLGIIDVPGHEDFVKNMVAGVGSIDLAMLVVAADDGWMPQTEEHLQILEYLGVRHGVVVLTKSDLPASIPDAVEDVRRHLKGTPLAHAPVVATSVVRQSGLNELRAQLTSVLQSLPEPPDIGKPRLPVDRVFTLRGVGTVVTGTLTGGLLRRGQQVWVQPAKSLAHIRTVHSYNREREQVSAGMRVALNLPELRPDETVSRGDVIALPDAGVASTTLDVRLEISGRAEVGGSLKAGSVVYFHHGSGHQRASVHFRGPDPLKPGETTIAQLRLEHPVFAFVADRFILRDGSERHTLAGGIVLDPHPPRRGWAHADRQDWLRDRDGSLFSAVGLVESQLKLDGTARLDTLLRQSRLSQPEIRAAIGQLVEEKKWIRIDSQLFTPDLWAALVKEVRGLIDKIHHDHPEVIGATVAEVRALVSKTLNGREVTDALLTAVCKDGFVREGAYIRRAVHRPALPAHMRAAGMKLRAAMEQHGLDIPSRKELENDPAAKAALRFLIQTGEVIELGPDVVISSAAYQKSLDRVRHFLTQKRSATLAELKQALNTSRRIMVPLAEKLDRDGITFRQGDLRTLR